MLSQRASETNPRLSPAVGAISRVWVTITSLRTRRRPPVQVGDIAATKCPIPASIAIRPHNRSLTTLRGSPHAPERQPPQPRPVRHFGVMPHMDIEAVKVGHTQVSPGCLIST